MELPKSLNIPTTISKVLAGVLFITLPFLGFYLGMRYQAVLTPKTPTLNPNPTSIPNQILDPTAGWKTYINGKFGFSLKYPEGWSFMERGTEYVRFFKGHYTENLPLPESYLSFQLKENPLTIQITPVLMGVESNEEKQGLQKVFGQILSTFKFVDNTSSTNLPAKKIEIPADWERKSAKDTYFGYQTSIYLPKSYVFEFTGSEWNLGDKSFSGEMWDYGSSFERDNSTNEIVNRYDGRSRRQWYLDYLNFKLPWQQAAYGGLTNDYSIVSAKEVSLGDKGSYLDLEIKNPYSNGRIERHFLYLKDGVMHMIKPVSLPALENPQKIPAIIDKIFYSLESSRT